MARHAAAGVSLSCEIDAAKLRSWEGWQSTNGQHVEFDKLVLGRPNSHGKD